MNDKNAEQLRACREAFEAYMRKEGFTDFARYEDTYESFGIANHWPTWQAAWVANTRADSGEAVAWMTHHDEPMVFTSRIEAGEYCEDDEQPIPLFTHPRAIAFDVRVTESMLDAGCNAYAKSYAGPNEWRDCMRSAIQAAIASREGEGK